MKINKITPSVDYNLLLKRLDTQFNESTKQNSIKGLKAVDKKRIRKRYYITLGTSVINSLLSPPNLNKNTSLISICNQP